MFKDLKVALLLLNVAVVPSTQAVIGCSPKCPEGQECKPRETPPADPSSTTVPTTEAGTAGVAGAGAGGASGAAAGGASGGTLGPDSAASSQDCSSSHTCVGTPPACSVWAGCDFASNKCKINQGAAGAGQCMDGDKRHCSTPAVPQGVYYCNPTLCDYKTADCIPCGANQQACCVGGCNIGFHCTDISNATKDSGKCVAN